jgi:hypothetical protein
MGTHLAHRDRPNVPGRGFVALAVAVPDQGYQSGAAYAVAGAFLALLAAAFVVHLFWGRTDEQHDPDDEDAAEAAPVADPPRVVLVSDSGRATSGTDAVTTATSGTDAVTTATFRTATSSRVTIAPSDGAPVVVLSYEPARGSVQWFASI